MVYGFAFRVYCGGSDYKDYCNGIHHMEIL